MRNKEKVIEISHGVRVGLAGVAAAALLLTACDRPVEAPTKPQAKPVQPLPDFVSLLPCPGSPMDILADDLNGDGRPDLAATLHAGNFSQIFWQDTPRVYRASTRLEAVGFHPGDWLRWPGAEPLYVAAAEGSGKLINFRINAAGGMDIVSQVGAAMPRHAAHFSWPGWGDSLVVTPYEMGMLELFRGYQPLQGKAVQRIPMGLGEDPATIRRADRVSVADIDADGVDELLYASRSTGEIFKVSRPPDGGKPKPEVVLELSEGAPHQVLAFDLDEDGTQDLVVPNQVQPYRINILLNQGKSGFRRANTVWPFPVQQGLRYADISTDRDGRAYLLVVGYGAVALYQVPKPWSENEAAPVRFIKINVRGMSSDIILRDMDGDQWLDAIVGYASGEHGIAIIHGPLWQHMSDLAGSGFVLE